MWISSWKLSTLLNKIQHGCLHGFLKFLGKFKHLRHQQGFIYANFRLLNIYFQTHNRYHVTALESLTMLWAFYFERWQKQGFIDYYKISILENFARFLWKHLRQSHSLIKLHAFIQQLHWEKPLFCVYLRILQKYTSLWATVSKMSKDNLGNCFFHEIMPDAYIYTFI